ncbi:MAG: hypothetical protein KF901_15070 [Myxococcales bacterium]|nr:hypothetical protein [Myxococcales bacterium]
MKHARGLHVVGGLLWTLPVAASLLWTLRGAASSRDAFLARAPSAGGAGALLLTLLLGAGLQVATLREAPGAAEQRPLQRLALLLALAFAAGYATLLWWPLARGAAPLDAYQALRQTLPHTLPAIGVGLGLAFFALHLELTLRAAWAARQDRAARHGRRERRDGRVLPALLTLGAVAFFFVALDAAAFFVLGERLVGAPPPPDTLFPTPPDPSS